MTWTIRFIGAPSGGEVPRFRKEQRFAALLSLRHSNIFATLKHRGLQSSSSKRTPVSDHDVANSKQTRKWRDGGTNNSNGCSNTANSMTPPHFQIQSPEFKPCRSRNALFRLPVFPTGSNENPATIDAKFYGREQLPHLASRFPNGFRIERAMPRHWSRSRRELIAVSSCFSMAGRVIWICGT